MDKNEEINYYINQLKLFEDQLHRQETMEERAIVRRDIHETRIKINELVRDLTDQHSSNCNIIKFMCIESNLLEDN